MNPLQGEQWLADKCGWLGASQFKDVLAKGQGKTRAAVLRRIVAENVTGKPTVTYQSDDMLRGIEQEPLAALAVEARTDDILELSGFIRHPTLRCGCSPDRLIGTEGGCEIKCVLPTVQVETILRGGYPPEHVAQVQGSLWITGRKFWNFASFCPEMPEHLRCYIFRVERDEKYIAELESEVRRFLEEVDAMLGRLAGVELKRAA